ncbi:uncharacterized protein PHALS_03339 [Plasmopara halstedii]|uniref:Uncharacterized protein n=1 Tax=Plasmopara halstedii TaxID=4781 RepID=A0A0P1A8P7_PLAHL|nr:uncharacterized protein PHALS_03339 [Plasmopara halstedii]CEG36671.1 hypothetical protein PHALS_03339 [Plasmopara halstedii]|eukprot:XP_024573040.1 hypothetical protein PHALS_03339 [Plasmopara halstedii]
MTTQKWIVIPLCYVSISPFNQNIKTQRRFSSTMFSSANESSSSTYEPTVYTLLLTGMCLLLALFLLTRLLAASSMRYLALYLLYWSPTPIQFANFSLLILFYIQVLTGPGWRSKWRNVCLPLYLLLTMTMTTFTVVWAFNSSNDISKAAREGDEYDQEFSQVSDVSVQLKYSAISFTLLSVLFGYFGWKMANVESWKRRRLLISKPRSLTVINSLLSIIFFTRGIRDLATSQSWFLSIWNNLDMNGRVTTADYFVFFCFWEFLPTVLLLCLISSKAGGVGAPKHGSASQKLPDYGIFHIINTGGGKLLTASPLGDSAYNSYGTQLEDMVGFERNVEHESQRWIHGGDLFQDPLRYDSDDGLGPSPCQFLDDNNSDARNKYYYERDPNYSMGL